MNDPFDHCSSQYVSTLLMKNRLIKWLIKSIIHRSTRYTILSSSGKTLIVSQNSFGIEVITSASEQFPIKQQPITTFLKQVSSNFYWVWQSLILEKKDSWNWFSWKLFFSCWSYGGRRGRYCGWERCVFIIWHFLQKIDMEYFINSF